MANIYLTDRVKQLVTQYNDLLPKTLDDLEDNAYIFMSSQEVSSYVRHDQCSVIVVLEDDENIMHQRGFNYIKNNPLQIVYFIQVLYCSPYYYFDQRFIDLEIDSHQDEELLYYKIDEAKEGLQYLHNNQEKICIIVFMMCLMVGLITACFVPIEYIYFIVTLMIMYTLVLVGVYGMYYLFDYIDHLILRKKYLKKIEHDEFSFYSLSKNVKSIEL